MTQIDITSKERELYPVLESNSKTNALAKNGPNWYYSEGDSYSQPARQDSQPNAAPNTASQIKPTNQTQPARQPNTDLVRESNAKNLVFREMTQIDITSKEREL